MEEPMVQQGILQDGLVLAVVEPQMSVLEGTH
ncbi:hypothetical protein ANAEL_01541 [Anaerolineales bacterium]|nr:hypothetical protein ANAEL_01541 [Anaerolineales bacterium]